MYYCWETVAGRFLRVPTRPRLFINCQFVRPSYFHATTSSTSHGIRLFLRADYDLLWLWSVLIIGIQKTTQISLNRHVTCWNWFTKLGRIRVFFIQPCASLIFKTFIYFVGFSLFVFWLVGWCFIIIVIIVIIVICDCQLCVYVCVYINI